MRIGATIARKGVVPECLMMVTGAAGRVGHRHLGGDRRSLALSSSVTVRPSSYALT